jgi:ATP-binding cassette subfamily B protein
VDAVVVYVSRGLGSHTRIWYLVALELAVALANDVLTRFSTLSDSLLTDRFTNRVRIDVIKHAATLDLSSFEDSLFHDSLERARNQSKGRMQLISCLLNLMLNVLSLAALSVGLIVLSPWLIVLLAAGLVPPLLGESRFTVLTYSSLFRWTPYRRFLDHLCYLGAATESAKEIKLFGLGQYLAEAYKVISSEMHKDHETIALKRATLGSALSIISTGSYYGAYVLILARTLAKTISIGTFTFLAGSFSRSRFYIDRIISDVTEVSEQTIFLRDLFMFFDARPSIRSIPNARAVPRPVMRGLEFRHVSFRYPGSERLALKDISFTLAPHQTMALVGGNGAGKTTLVKLLLRLYDPAEGDILLDGVNLRDYDLTEYHGNVSVLFQDFMKYEMLVSDNIGFGDIQQLGNQNRTIAAAEESGADEMIGRLPKAYEQMLGRQFEGGVALSGGEWQKLALARAYMRDAQLMILDEPSSTLDARAEHELFDRIAKSGRNRMLVLISHRLSTVRMADQILVLSEGIIRERGPHEDLIRLGQHYAELFELQASSYR